MGGFIADHPGYFLIVPIFFTIVCLTGIQKLNWTDDPEYLFAPLNGRARKERRVAEELFSSNHTRSSRYVTVGFETKFGANIINKTIWDDMVAIDKYVQHYEFDAGDGRKLTFQDICFKNNDKCTGNNLLNLADKIPLVASREFNLTYPVMLDPDTFSNYVFPGSLGGIELFPETTIKSARATRLVYSFKSDTDEDNRM